jgi:rhodanese-related sulfurtransferase
MEYNQLCQTDIGMSLRNMISAWPKSIPHIPDQKLTKDHTMTKSSASKKTASKSSMKMWLVAAAVVIMAVIAVMAFFPRGKSESFPQEVPVAEAKAMVDGGAYVVDVRQPEEWNQVHIPGATLIPLGELQSRLSEVPKDKPVVVVCRSGNRSQQGRDILLKAGFDQVTSMAGGVNQWTAAGYPTVSGP